MSAISCCSPMAAPVPCTPSRWPARSAWAKSSCRSRRAFSRPSACCSPTCATISCAPGSRRWKTQRSSKSKKSIARWSSRAATPSPATSVKPQKIATKRAADMRYVGQEHAVTVDLPMALFARKDREASSAIRRHARAALRHVRAERARRDRQPALDRNRRDAQAAAAKRSRAAKRRRPKLRPMAKGMSITAGASI